MAMLEKVMSTVKLRNDQWRKIVEFLCENPKVYVGEEKQCRRFVEAVKWIMKSGAQWRLLPNKYGNWNSVYKRYSRWSQRGVWQEMFEHFVDDPDMESVMLDSSVVRAHACAAGAPAKKGVNERKHSATAEVGLARKSTLQSML